VYQIRLQVIDDNDFTSSRATVNVIVYQAEIVAVILGGSSRTVSLMDTLNIDASASYDDDVQYLTGSAAGLSFSWSCFELTPSLGGNCTVDMPIDNTKENITVKASYANSTGTSSQILVEVFDSDRSSTAVVTVTVVPSTSPIAEITSVFSRKVNPTEEIIISATYYFQNSGFGSWQIDDSTLNIDSIASSTTSFSFSTIQGVVVSLNTNLVIQTNALSERSTYLFTLEVIQDSGELSYATISIFTNGPPQPGEFLVTPENGVSILDDFLFSASGWEDSDLPLTFEFGFYTASGIYQTVQTFSELSYGTTILPAGLSSANNSIVCIVIVYDSLSLSSTDTYTVTVTDYASNRRRLQNSNTSSTAQMVTAIRSALYSSDSINSLTQVVAVGAESLNSVACTAAPNCTLLHRKECTSTYATCGECMDSYIGEYGDKNTPCVDPSTTSDSKAGSTCDLDSDCGVYETCEANTCEIFSKTCPADCSGNGKCVFISSLTYQVQSTCDFGNANCEAICICDSGYEGIGCFYTDEDILERTQTRLSLLLALRNLTTSQDVSTQTVSTWTNSLATLTEHIDEIADDFVDFATNISGSILEYAAVEGYRYYRVQNIVNTIDKVSQYYSFKLATSLSDRRRLLSSQSQTALVQQFSSVVLSNMVDGQDDIIYFGDVYSLICSKASSNDAGFVELLSAVSDYDAYSGVQSHKIILALATTVDYAGLAIGSFKLSSYESTESTSTFVSNPLVLVLEDTSVCPDSTCQAFVITPTIQEETYLNASDTFPTYSTICVADVVSLLQYTCPDGFNITLRCDGRFEGSLISQCPYYITQPACVSLDGSDVINDNVCNTTYYNGNSTSCTCAFTSTDLSSAFPSVSSLSSTSAIELVSVRSQAVLTPVEPDSYITNMPSSSPTSAPTIRQIHHKQGFSSQYPVFVIFITFSIIIVGCGIYFCCVYLPPRMRRKRDAIVDGSSIMLTPFDGETEHDLARRLQYGGDDEDDSDRSHLTRSDGFHYTPKSAIPLTPDWKTIPLGKDSVVTISPHDEIPASVRNLDREQSSRIGRRRSAELSYSNFYQNEAEVTDEIPSTVAPLTYERSIRFTESFRNRLRSAADKSVEIDDDWVPSENDDSPRELHKKTSQELSYSNLFREYGSFEESNFDDIPAAIRPESFSKSFHIPKDFVMHQSVENLGYSMYDGTDDIPQLSSRLAESAYESFHIPEGFRERLKAEGIEKAPKSTDMRLKDSIDVALDEIGVPVLSMSTYGVTKDDESFKLSPRFSTHHPPQPPVLEVL
jgi:hypothetical protein